MIGGRFEILGPPIGHGSTGVVLPALDRRADREVVIKLLHDHLASDPEVLSRLEADAGAAARLQHRHILRVHGVWSEGGRWFLVADRVHGCAIDAVEGPMTPEAVLALGRQLAEALRSAHAVGVVHGDVRPGNVLLGRGGATLFDFGLAGCGGARPGESAPETLAGAPATVASDLYGLGVVLYRAMTGRMPFTELTPWARMGAQRRSAPRTPPGPKGLAHLVAALLATDPARRPADAASVSAALGRLLRNPSRPVRIGRPWLPPIRPRAAWLVHGIDPTTGGPSVVRVGLSRGRALALAGRLREAGWEVDVAKEALGGRDIAAIGLAVVAGGIALPVLGGVLAGGLTLHALAAECRPELRRVLPTAEAPVPPRELASGTEHAVMAALLLFVAAVALFVFPPAALPPVALLIWVTADAWRRRRGDLAGRAALARLGMALEAARGAIDRAGLGADHGLALHGELNALEESWKKGEVGADALLVHAENLRARLGADPRSGPSGGRRTIEALELARKELGPDPSATP